MWTVCKFSGPGSITTGPRELASLARPRAHFALQPMCGSLVSIGGVSGEEYLTSVESLSRDTIELSSSQVQGLSRPS